MLSYVIIMKMWLLYFSRLFLFVFNGGVDRNL